MRSSLSTASSSRYWVQSFLTFEFWVGSLSLLLTDDVLSSFPVIGCKYYLFLLWHGAYIMQHDSHPNYHLHHKFYKNRLLIIILWYIILIYAVKINWYAVWIKLLVYFGNGDLQKAQNSYRQSSSRNRLKNKNLFKIVY